MHFALGHRQPELGYSHHSSVAIEAPNDRLLLNSVSPPAASSSWPGNVQPRTNSSSSSQAECCPVPGPVPVPTHLDCRSRVWAMAVLLKQQIASQTFHSLAAPQWAFGGVRAEHPFDSIILLWVSAKMHLPVPRRAIKAKERRCTQRHRRTRFVRHPML